ncbi:hypothetical protein D3C73_943550 [compost metagenome]
MSSVTATGVVGSISRRRRSRSPSASSTPSATMAPCRSSKMASKPPSLTWSSTSLHRRSWVSALVGPLGQDSAATGTTISAPTRRATSIYPPSPLSVFS